MVREPFGQISSLLPALSEKQAGKPATTDRFRRILKAERAA
jgi:hypothetical protein